MGAAERLSYILQGASLMFFLFASISLLQSDQRSRLKTVLAFIVAFFAFGEMKDLVRIIPSVTESAYALRLLYTIDIWTIGVCAAYLIELVSPRWFTFRRALLLSLVFILFTVLYAITGSNYVFIADLIYVAIFSVVVLVRLAALIVRYNRFIRNNYSNLERVNLNWLYSVVVVFVVSIVVWTIYLFNHNHLMKSVYYIISLIAWIMLIARSKKQIEVTFDSAATRRCHFASNSSESATPSDEPQNEEQCSEEAADSSQLSEQMKTQLEELMSVREIYLNSHLTLSDLAAELGTNRTYLSNYLNRELKVSFYDYVNSFRVKRACRMIEADPDVTVHAIVESCGFNSVSTFRRSFSREIGRTYGEYRQNVLSQSPKA